MVTSSGEVVKSIRGWFVTLKTQVMTISIIAKEANRLNNVEVIELKHYNDMDSVEVMYFSIVHVLKYKSGREDMHIGAFHNAQEVLSIPSAVIGCKPRSGYASVHICWLAHWHFCLLADASWATKPVSIVYYFFLCIRAQTLKMPGW